MLSVDYLGGHFVQCVDLSGSLFVQCVFLLRKRIFTFLYSVWDLPREGILYLGGHLVQ